MHIDGMEPAIAQELPGSLLARSFKVGRFVARRAKNVAPAAQGAESVTVSREEPIEVLREMPDIERRSKDHRGLAFEGLHMAHGKDVGFQTGFMEGGADRLRDFSR